MKLFLFQKKVKSSIRSTPKLIQEQYVAADTLDIAIKKCRFCKPSFKFTSIRLVGELL